MMSAVILNSWHSYPQVYALGHRYVADLLLDPVLVEEKIDGSQFSFGMFHINDIEDLRCRSKGAQLQILAPDKMFARAVDVVKMRSHLLHPGWTYRAEYLTKPKHNALAYDRIPKDHLMIFDINTAEETYLSYEQKMIECERLGFEHAPGLYYGTITTVQQIRDILDSVSCLGGQKIEGVVIKNYHRYGLDKKVLMGKFVSEAFKEVHAREWKAANPGKMDVVQMLIETLKTPARWHKAVQHLRERGVLENDPRDIGQLFKEVPADVEKEEADFIKQKLFEWAWPHIRRGVTAGLPEWYKEQLLARQFEKEEL